MKKFLFVLLFASLGGAMTAQTVVYGRQPNHHYRDWFDTCYNYYAGTPLDWHPTVPVLRMWNTVSNGYIRMKEAFPGYADQPLTIKGIAVMQNDNRDFGSGMPESVLDLLDTEYVSIGYYDSSKNSFNILATARWDTAQYKIWRLKMIADTTRYPDQATQPIGYATCHLYEALFDHPVTVDSLYYIIGTANGNRDSMQSGSQTLSARRRVKYQRVSTGTSPTSAASGSCVVNDYPNVHYAWTAFNGWYDISTSPFGYGPFIPIIEPPQRQWRMTLHSTDSLMGYAVGSPIVGDSMWADIRAYANYGCRFTHWSDGDSSNPRRVFITSDTTFTAHFDSVPFHTITLSVNNRYWGYTHPRGSSTHPENEGVRITAYDHQPRTEFVCWSDGVYNPDRVIYLTSDTSLQAIFRQVQDTTSDTTTAVRTAETDNGIVFTLSPNPTTGSAKLVATDFESHLYDYRRAAVVVLDVAGHEVFRTPLTAPTVSIPAHPSGAYIVTLVTPTASGTQKLVVK